MVAFRADEPLPSILKARVLHVATFRPGPSLPDRDWCQDNVTPISHCFQKEWNPSSKVAMEDWLDPNLDEESRLRLRAIGNIVVPCQAAMGFSILSEVAKLATSLPDA